LSALLGAAGVPPEREGDTLIALDKLDKIGADGVTQELIGRGIPADTAAACMRMFAAPAGADEGNQAGVLAALEARLGDRKDALDTVRTIIALSEKTPAAGRIRVDPSLARGLSYYTGAIMEIAVPDLAGSLGGGGRYDNLIGMFLGRNVPACGFSLGLERIIVVMTERGMFPASVGSAPADVMVALWDEAGRADALALAADLRKGGLRVDVYPEPDKPGKQFKYASSRNYQTVVLVGEDERAAGTVNVKNMRTSSQVTVPRADVLAHIQRESKTEQRAE
jgi:histidyl-tRNA synthetase